MLPKGQGGLRLTWTRPPQACAPLPPSRSDWLHAPLNPVGMCSRGADGPLQGLRLLISSPPPAPFPADLALFRCLCPMSLGGGVRVCVQVRAPCTEARLRVRGGPGSQAHCVSVRDQAGTVRWGVSARTSVGFLGLP